MKHDTNFYDPVDFPQLREIFDNWQIMAQELAELKVPVMEVNRIGKSHVEVYQDILSQVMSGKEYGWVKGWGENKENSDWLQLALIIQDHPMEFLPGKLERTMSMLGKLSGLKVCALVKMNSRTMLHMHQHPEIESENLLQLHLTLDVPETQNYNYLNVNGEFRQHSLGEPILFSGAKDHFAFNESLGSRTILYMEFSKDNLACAD
ncbi:aspartyl/asparaginyl beta-hydroxylase domain-containing protein [Pseudoalteromonas aurantia]|uniref:Aspartyl beta-hydroxylase n=1 Tax=Pseudoalteromonas aurantia TaxID=43654 RepID=A0A5S3VCK9_9GAMM|nr:aspartyl/asparaginyl beta-hydroxylase domain-containing protein [Pseudoalteromonas aurantia]TMO69883.1 aspartyl beta-hydroxylase [Pseudoalteromonas aurantia]TMO75138.1 aspartyl beta-hydroxylase [Pseudoalteromonas aurantia]